MIPKIAPSEGSSIKMECVLRIEGKPPTTLKGTRLEIFQQLLETVHSPHQGLALMSEKDHQWFARIISLKPHKS